MVKSELKSPQDQVQTQLHPYLVIFSDTVNEVVEGARMLHDARNWSSCGKNCGVKPKSVLEFQLLVVEDDVLISASLRLFGHDEAHKFPLTVSRSYYFRVMVVKFGKAIVMQFRFSNLNFFLLTVPTHNDVQTVDRCVTAFSSVTKGVDVLELSI